MQLWLQDPHSVEKLMDMKRLEKKGALWKSTEEKQAHTPYDVAWRQKSCFKNTLILEIH